MRSAGVGTNYSSCVRNTLVRTPVHARRRPAASRPRSCTDRGAAPGTAPSTMAAPPQPRLCLLASLSPGCGRGSPFGCRCWRPAGCCRGSGRRSRSFPPFCGSRCFLEGFPPPLPRFITDPPFHSARRPPSPRRTAPGAPRRCDLAEAIGRLSYYGMLGAEPGPAPRPRCVAPCQQLWGRGAVPSAVPAVRCTILHSGADRALLTSHSHPHNGLRFSCS